MEAAILLMKQTHFVLWRAQPNPAPRLIIGKLQPGGPVSFDVKQEVDMQPATGSPDLWTLPAAQCKLTDGEVYHYWFEVTDAHPQRPGKRIRITDPMAFAVDWRLTAAHPGGPGYSDDDQYPAAVVMFKQGKLIGCDIGGEGDGWQNELPLTGLPPNNRLVIYELPAAWTRTGSGGERERGLGTFRDVTALVDPDAEGENFADLAVTAKGYSYLTELGVNAIELCPPADSFYVRQWGYGTTNFFAPDFELGFPATYSWPRSNCTLRTLINACHSHGLRFFTDVVMAFAKVNAYLAGATNDFFILEPKADSSDPDAYNSRGKGKDNVRNGFGSTLFRYAAAMNGYDPISGQQATLYPARQLMKAGMLRWVNDFHIDGIRLDSVENVSNRDFIQEYKDLARKAWQDRFAGQATPEVADQRFLVVGEELEEPLALLTQKRLDGLWHERFKRYIRAALLGQSVDDKTNFEWTVRKAIDCRHFGYTDGAQAIIYLTSHDVEGYRNERLLNFFRNSGVGDAERRIKLAFACLLTAVGIPMILAGEEFADQHDFFGENGNVSQDGGKQVDPVNFSRLGDEWRQRVRHYVGRLIKLRTTSDALAVNDTEFIHVDIADGKRVLAWRRGQSGSDSIVVVVANFSDFGTADPGNSTAEYRVHNWPATPPGKTWREVTQERPVPQEWIGREPLFPWEAKVYTTA